MVYNINFPAPSFTFNERSWEDQARCVGDDGDVFFAVDNWDVHPMSARIAKAVCVTCHVRAECLDHAMTVNEQYGIWGGLTPTERTAIRRAQLRVPR